PRGPTRQVLSSSVVPKSKLAHGPEVFFRFSATPWAPYDVLFLVMDGNGRHPLSMAHNVLVRKRPGLWSLTRDDGMSRRQTRRGLSPSSSYHLMRSNDFPSACVDWVLTRRVCRPESDPL